MSTKISSRSIIKQFLSHLKKKYGGLISRQKQNCILITISIAINFEIGFHGSSSYYENYKTMKRLYAS